MIANLASAMCAISHGKRAVIVANKYIPRAHISHPEFGTKAGDHISVGVHDTDPDWALEFSIPKQERPNGKQEPLTLQKRNWSTELTENRSLNLISLAEAKDRVRLGLIVLIA